MRINSITGLIVLLAIAVAAPASALDRAQGAPAPQEEAQRVAEEPAAPIAEPDVQIEFVGPEGQDLLPPVATTAAPQPAKIDAADFGVGWPAAVAVGVALAAVLAMALMWRREPTM